MFYEDFVSEMNALGFRVNGKNGYGSYQGMPVHCVFAGKTKAKRVTVMMTLQGNPVGAFFRAAKKAMKGIGEIGALKTSARQPGILCIGLTPAVSLTASLEQTMGALLPLIEEYHMRPEDSCALCHGSGCNGYALVEGVYQPVHHECLIRYSDSVREQSEKNLSEGKYLSGILGGLAGGIIATVPTILTILFMERIFAILMWLIPMGVAYGYKKCNGKRSKAAGPIMIVLSLLSLYVMEYVFWLRAFVEAGYSVEAALQRTLPFLLDPTFWVDMTTHAVTELLFLVLAIFMAWKPLMQTAKGDVQDAGIAVDTYVDRTA